jgi:hypothetical protein
MSAPEVRIKTFVVEMVVLGMASGLTYREGTIAARALLMMTEAIDKDPNVNEEQLEARVLALIREELAKPGGCK